MIKTIWTEAYRPFIMGGDVNAPVSCDAEVADPIDAGRGFWVYRVVSPSGKSFFAEKSTGAIIGSSLKEVKEDIRTANLSVMRKQIRDAKVRASHCVPVSVAEFWRLLRADK